MSLFRFKELETSELREEEAFNDFIESWGCREKGHRPYTPVALDACEAGVRRVQGLGFRSWDLEFGGFRVCSFAHLSLFIPVKRMSLGPALSHTMVSKRYVLRHTCAARPGKSESEPTRHSRAEPAETF